MWLLAVLKSGLDFSGRARRREWFWFMLQWNAILFVINAVLTTLLYVTMRLGVESTMSGGSPDVLQLVPVLITALIGFNLIYNAVFFLPSLALTIRRLHDIGRPGSNVLWLLLPLVGPLILLAHMITPSAADNEYGGPARLTPT